MGGDILGAGEISVYDGPWLTPNRVRKINAVLRWIRGTEADGFGITGMAYANRFNATNQIPLRAVQDGLMSRWGAINPTDGGDTTRFSLSGHWANSATRITLASKVTPFIRPWICSTILPTFCLIPF